MIEIHPVGVDRLDDLATLFGAAEVTRTCWCMWDIIAVADFHAAGEEGNRAAFGSLALTERDPMGLLAYEGGSPVGWCAVGPRARYARAVRTPTLRAHVGATADDDEWFVPCFYVAPDVRGEGVARALLVAAVDLARSAGAGAIAGFPLAGDKRRSPSVGASQAGVEGLFRACGFEAVDRPSDNRVVMRRELV